ncbi:hypothetical protein EBZ37_10260, partial [bacterium]|nr:hypothetical protein [bacterium]
MGRPVRAQSERREIPEGREGLLEHAVILPPVLVGEAVKPETPRGNATGLENVKSGGVSIMDNVNVFVVDLAEDAAKSVTVPEEKTFVGVPEIVHEFALTVMLSPVGRAG